MVGNSGLLRHYKLGEMIDAHSAVFRMDAAPVKGAPLQNRNTENTENTEASESPSLSSPTSYIPDLLTFTPMCMTS